MRSRVGLIVVILVFVSTPLFAQGRCSLAGTWTGENDAGLVFLITFTPLNNSHSRFSAFAGHANDPTGFGLFPAAVDLSAFQGEAQRTNIRTFYQTALAYVRDDFGWIGTWAVSGTWTLSKDCGTAEVVWQASAFFPGQDPIADPPFFCFPLITGVYHRVPVVASSCPE